MSIKLITPLHLTDGRAARLGPLGAPLNPGEASEVATREKVANLALVTYEALELKRNRPRDVAALHAMQAARPLKPPPYEFGERRPVAGLLSVREDRKAGVLV